MKLIVGLGNPGSSYYATRHNSGFMFLDYLAHNLGFEFSFDKKVNGDIAKHNQTLFLKPQTFMNKSGESVRKALDYFDLEASDLVLVHDDIAFDVGEYKVSQSGGANRHKGVENVLKHVGTPYFTRLRLGVGWDNTKGVILEDYVLTRFSKKELETLQQTFKSIELSTIIGG